MWQEAPEWQPTREVVEQLTAVGDWCQLLFATNIVFEQLVGSLFRSELVMQIAARNGDYITPTIVGTGEHDYDRDLNYTRNLFRLLTRDPEHGEANKALFGEWLATWVPRCLDAAYALQPIWSTPADKAGHLRVEPRRGQGEVPFRARKHRARHPRGVGQVSMQFGSATEFSNMCGVTLMNTPIGRVVAEVMGAKDGVELTEYPSMIRVDGVRLLDFDYDELSEALGQDFDGSDLRGDQLDALRAHGPPRRQDDPVRQPGGRRRVHRLRPHRAAVGEGAVKALVFQGRGSMSWTDVPDATVDRSD